MTLAEYFSQRQATRRQRLALLIDRVADGVAAAFAAQFGYSESQISQYLSATYRDGKALSDYAARALEEKASLPFGWLDAELAAPTIDHAAELRAALEQTRIVFESVREGEQVLSYLLAVLAADSPATDAWLQGGLLPDQDQPETLVDASSEPATPSPSAPIVTKLTVDIDTSAIDAAMVKLEALKVSAAEARVPLSHETGAAPADEFNRLMTAVHAATDLAEQQIERAERATAATMDLARRCQHQEEQIASLIAALGALSVRA